MRFNLRKKLVSGFGICVLLMVGLVAYSIFALQRLESLYRASLKCSFEVELATDAQHIGEDLYLVIANAVINRDLVKTDRDWAATKLENRAKLRKVAEAADIPQERAKVDEAETAFNELISIFETRMLPLIKADASVPGPLSAIDAEIDTRIEAINQSLQFVARSISADNARVSKEFHDVLTHSIEVGLGCSSFGLLAALLISALTTRWVVRPMAEITRAADQMAQGNYLVELRHHSSDETGVLAHAFRQMAAEVARHTVELEETNGRLHREVCDRRLSEAEVSRLNAELEGRVVARTAELVQANQCLESVIQTQQEAELELQRSRAELRSLTQHLQEVREAERASISREIHDDLGQMLTALKIDLAWVGKNLPEQQRNVIERTLKISGHIDQTIGTVQRISAQLRPGILDDLGLAAALEWQAQEFQKKTGIVFEVQCSVDCSVLSRRCATELFRIFQETLSNIYRHSEATRARATLVADAAQLTVTVSDNGRGVSADKISHHKSLGFIGMRERALSLGGELTISRKPDGGTCIQVVIPLDAGKEGVAS